MNAIGVHAVFTNDEYCNDVKMVAGGLTVLGAHEDDESEGIADADGAGDAVAVCAVAVADFHEAFRGSEREDDGVAGCDPGG